ncbi:Protein kinase domain containing protein, partial [Reticulomyxa filosa]
FGKDTNRLNAESEGHEKELAALRSQIESEKEKSQQQLEKVCTNNNLIENNRYNYLQYKIYIIKKKKTKENELAELDRSLRQQLSAKELELQNALKELEQARMQNASHEQKHTELQEQIQTMKDQTRELENTITIQDEEISGYKDDAQKKQELNLELEKKLSEQSNTLNERIKDMQNEKGQMLMALKLAKDQLGMKDEEIKKLKQLLEQSRRDSEKYKKEHEEYLNRPREEKSIQTDVVGQWFEDNSLKVADLERLRGETERLTSELAFADTKVRGLTDETKVLVNEIEYLIKQAAKSVRLWKVNPEADGKEEKVIQVYASSHLERQAPALAFSKDGLCW